MAKLRMDLPHPAGTWCVLKHILLRILLIVSMLVSSELIVLCLYRLISWRMLRSASLPQPVLSQWRMLLRTTVVSCHHIYGRRLLWLPQLLRFRRPLHMVRGMRVPWQRPRQ